MANPAINYKDAKGYKYDETAQWWKNMCVALPCFAQLAWPGYDTRYFDARIDGKPVVIQLWKGWCQRFLGLNAFPGGIGAEVGVYRRITGRAKPNNLASLPPAIRAFFETKLARINQKHLWWPYPELNAKIEFTLINPKTKKAFFKHPPKTTYWANKWMHEGSYLRYVGNQGFRVPAIPTRYRLEYKINGREFKPW